jgi:plastocyanin
MHRNLNLASATLVLLAALIPVTSCERTTQSAQPKVVTVAIRDYKFVPETVTVHQGDTVEWKNEDNVLHTATADGQAQKPAFDSGNISKAAAWRYVAATKGKVNYTCTFHPYMKGELIVQ